MIDLMISANGIRGPFIGGADGAISDEKP